MMKKKFFSTALLLLLSTLTYFIALKIPFFYEIEKTHRLSETTLSLLKKFEAPVYITLNTQEVDLYQKTKVLIERYQAVQPLIHFKWDQQKSRILELNYLNQHQEIDIEKVQPDENEITQALFKLHRKPNEWVVFLQGHGEPSPFGTQNNDVGLFRLALENQGLKVQALDLTQTPVIPANTQVLIIASPRSSLLPKEEALLLEFILKGGNVLWLIDPASIEIPLLNKVFGVSPLAGTIADLHGQKLGTPHPAITIVDSFPALPFQPPHTILAFPWAVALQQAKENVYQTKPLLITHHATWTERGDFSGEIAFDPEKDEVAGPLLLGIGLTDQQQRVAIIGNSRFLSNGAVQNYGNLAFGLNLLNWLSHDDMLLNISQPIVQDTLLQVHFWPAMIIQYGFPVGTLIVFLIFIILFAKRSRHSKFIQPQA